MNISFKKAEQADVKTIFSWLEQDFIKEFWDNSQAHKDDILNFVEGRKTPSDYCDGNMVYWIASLHDKPYAMLMTEHLTLDIDFNQIKKDNFSKTGNTYGLDYMIGNPNFFGKGYGATTLSEFMIYFRKAIDKRADSFLIDPAADNPRAKHVYMKAGFEYIADFIMEGECSGKGKLHHLLRKDFA